MMDFTSPGTTEWLVIAGVVLLIVILLVAVMAARRRRKQSLHQRYGPEYERTVRARGGAKAARQDLADREREHEDLRLRDLDRRERQEFGQRMARLQYRFAEDPAGAVYEAGRVAADALRARGYPITEDRDRALGLLAVDHPQEAQPLRTAIEGTYGKDQGRLRETFMQVRDGLRDVVGVHYGEEDGVEEPDAARTTSPADTPTAAGTGAAAGGAGTAATGQGPPRDEGLHEDDGRDDSRDRAAGDTETAGGRHVAGQERETDDHAEDAEDAEDRGAGDSTVPLDGADGSTGRPVGAVPPPPGGQQRG